MGARAHGREETYQHDLEWPEVPDAVRALPRAWSRTSTRRAGRRCGCYLKVRYRNFFTLTRSRKLQEPSNDPVVLGDVAVALLEKVEPDKPVRLLGVRLRWCRRRVATSADHIDSSVPLSGETHSDPQTNRPSVRLQAGQQVEPRERRCRRTAGGRLPISPTRRSVEARAASMTSGG